MTGKELIVYLLCLFAFAIAYGVAAFFFHKWVMGLLFPSACGC